MKKQWALLAALSFTAGSLPAVAAPSKAQAKAPAKALLDSQKVARQLTAILPRLRAIKNGVERESTLRLVATALARGGDHASALQVAQMVPERKWDENIRDEVRRIRARQLAQKGDAVAAMQVTAQIKGEFSRADALLGVARAELKAKKPDAAKAVLRKAEPLVRGSNSALAVSYLAWLYTRVGEDSAARGLFELAARIGADNDLKGNVLGDVWKWQQSIALYQARAGWTEAAFKTIDGDSRHLAPVRAVLAERGEWQPLVDFAGNASGLDAVTYLVELAGVQLEHRDTKAALASRTLAQTRFSQLSESERNSSEGVFHQALLALLEIAGGEDVTGRAHFAALSSLPNFSPDVEMFFYYNLAVPSGFLKVTQSPQQQLANEKAATAALVKLKDYSGRVYNFIEIAELQQKRGDKKAMRETLELARAQVRENVAKPKKDADDIDLVRWLAAPQLMAVAKIERGAGDEKAALATLLQAKKLIKKRSLLETASALLDAGFVREAGAMLEKAAPLTDKESLDASYDSRFEKMGPRYAKKAGVDAALRWVLKIPDVNVRAQTLSGILVALNPLPFEERELILRGNRTKGAQVTSQFSLPGYMVSQNFNEFE